MRPSGRVHSPSRPFRARFTRTHRPLNPKHHAIERVFPAAHDGERERDHHEQEFECPPGCVRFLELAMGLRPEERDRAEHHDDEAEGGELREEAEDEAEGSRGLGDREDAEVAQHAGGHAVRRLGTPEAALGQAVQQEDAAERETEQEARDVTVLMERGEEAHGLLPEGWGWQENIPVGAPRALHVATSNRTGRREWARVVQLAGVATVMRYIAIVLLAALAVPRAAAQSGAGTDIISGRVTGPDSQPLEGVVVVATSVETQLSRPPVAARHGRFTIVFPDGGGQYRVVARFMGMAPVEQVVRRQGDEDRLEANIQMGSVPVSLEGVTVAARRGAGPSTSSGGSTAQSLSPEQMTRLPIDATDLNAVAALAPGVLPIAATDSTTTAFSVAGQRSTANYVTLDGMSFGQGTVPQDALRSTRVITTTYDVARGEFSGGLVTSTTKSGTSIPQGSFTAGLRDRSLAWGTATESPFGAGSTQNQVSGGLGGAIVPNRLFVFGALQHRWRDQALPSLISADPAALLRLGVSPDSAARFRALAGATGATATRAGAADRAADLTVALVRFDWRMSDAHTLTLRLDGRSESQASTRGSPLAFPASGGTRSEGGGGVLAALASSFGGSIINELRGYVATSRRDVTPFLSLPVARVDVASQLPDVGQAIATLAFGGNGALPQHIRTRSIEVSDEVSWLLGGGAHRPKLGIYVNTTRGEETEMPNQFGTFEYPSLGALASDSPAVFTRSRVPLAQAGTVWNEALYLGDSWRVPGGVRLTYGVRLEATRFGDAPAYNGALDSLFGVRTDRIPDDVQLLPRLGFTWGLGAGREGGVDASSATYLRGGIGEFRSPPPTFLYSASLGAPGFLNAATDLVCVGPAA